MCCVHVVELTLLFSLDSRLTRAVDLAQPTWYEVVVMVVMTWIGRECC